MVTSKNALFAPWLRLGRARSVTYSNICSLPVRGRYSLRSPYGSPIRALSPLRSGSLPRRENHYFWR